MTLHLGNNTILTPKTKARITLSAQTQIRKICPLEPDDIQFCSEEGGVGKKYSDEGIQWLLKGVGSIAEKGIRATPQSSKGFLRLKQEGDGRGNFGTFFAGRKTPRLHHFRKAVSVNIFRFCVLSD